jgi:hypothetical protein
MHPLVATEDGVCWACVNAQRTTDAPVFIDVDHIARSFRSKRRIKGFFGHSSQLRQPGHTCLTTGRALVDVRLTSRNGLCIGRAIRKAATRALRLRQNIQNPES